MSVRGRIAFAALVVGAVAGCDDGAPVIESGSPLATEQAAAETAFRHPKNVVVVDVRIGGSGPYTFLVDTGVTPSVIDTDLARTLGLSSEEDKNGEAGGAGTEFPVTITGLEIAGTVLNDIEAIAVPLQGLGEKLGEPLHGILGYSFLKTRAIRIDYVKHTLAFSDTPTPFEGDFETADFVTPMVFGGDIMPIIDVSLSGRTFIASIDTGSSLGLEIFSDAVEKLGLTRTVAGWEVDEATGERGTMEIRNGVLPRVAIGPLTFTDVVANVGPRRHGNYRDGNIGNMMWQGYVLVFDYVEKRVAFRKSSAH